MYRLDKEIPMTVGRMDKYITQHKAYDVRRMDKLLDYYMVKNKINRRSLESDTGLYHNRIAHPYASYITDIYVGYFMGEQVSYSAGEDDSKLLELLNGINAYNDEGATNAELATDASIFGLGIELMYIDTDGKIRYKRIDPRQMMLIYDTSIEEELLYAIRYYVDADILTSETTEYAEVYSAADIRRYRRTSSGLWVESESIPHAFGLVPISPYFNNSATTGDFEQVISLIDAYDKAESDTLNDYSAFADAYLALKGMEGTEEEDLSALRRNKVLLLPTDGDAAWLTKNQSAEFVEALKTRLDKDIHKFAKCPAMTDEEFAGNASGVAMQYKLMGLETATSKKERAFRKGLQRRIELICNILRVLTGQAYDYTSISMSFKRNLPANFSEIADNLGKIGHLLSRETQVGLLPIDVDYAAEKERLEAEAEEGYTLPEPAAGMVM
ncbi:MAG: phage portal protein [Eubacteriales bacterium]|nr:phage portal protein [Eubacteriales bacterium]